MFISYLLSFLSHSDCFAILNEHGCELGLNTLTQGRQINNREQRNTFIQMDVFAQFIEGKRLNIINKTNVQFFS